MNNERYYVHSVGDLMAEDKNEEEPILKPTGFQAEHVSLKKALNPNFVEKLEEMYDEIDVVTLAIMLIEKEGEEKTLKPLALSHRNPEQAEKGITEIQFDESREKLEEIVKALSSV
ncbi:hypothetical protein AKJ51_00035 [candidate division MSBL1 archaeon SCGC-AAA382A20]|uniref:Uncharacterized protein n=1 Tax=candidate division MSBL1 archaeon SCGC-AAA382A20 TaxID=1698280 RepID=A0A133VMQ6_9EURY|nr:hypothetical protein AKJ51_00035 [candidate division MSBL1 archaeon SCGC-AAA382A20]